MIKYKIINDSDLDMSFIKEWINNYNRYGSNILFNNVVYSMRIKKGLFRSKVYVVKIAKYLGN